MQKLFTVICQGRLDEVKRILEKHPEAVNEAAGLRPKKDHGQSPLQVAFKTGRLEIVDVLMDHGADFKAWAGDRELSSRTNRDFYRLDDYSPRAADDTSHRIDLRIFLQEYFRSRNVQI
jgi:hypothetical protein